MRFASGLLVAALFGSGASAKEEVPACVFDKVVAFGASVTQATPAMIPGYRSFVVGAELYGSINGNDKLPRAGSPLRNFSYRPWGLSPVRYLIKNYLGASGAKKIEYIGKYFTQSEEDLGSSQIRELLIGGKKTTFENTTLLVGVDAFYWDAIWNNCGYGRRVGVEDHIRLLTRTASHRGLTLVLGNVPYERRPYERQGRALYWRIDDSSF